MKLRPLSFTRYAPSPLRCVGMGNGGGGRRRTIVVALRRDAAGRELLTWALVKAATAGDRVIALHVSTAAAADGEEMPAAEEEKKARANDSLASVLGAYRGFCERNQIDLELQLCEAPSIKKALVAEATSCAAAHLILGVAKTPSGYALHTSSAATGTAVARYCAKRVPPSCMVTAVANGAVVYRRDPVHHHHHHHHQPLLLSPYSAVVETPRRLYRKILDAKTTTASQDDMAIGDARSAHRNMSAAMSALVSPRVKLRAPTSPASSCRHGQQQESPKKGDGRSARRNMSAAMSALVSPRVRSCRHGQQESAKMGDGRSARRNMSAAMSALVSPRVKLLAPASPARSCHGLQQESPKMAAGWPLLKKDNMPALPELSEVSVVEWAMQLPARCSDQRSDEQGEEKPVPEELVSLRDKYSSKYTVFGYSELAKITNGFSADRLVGRGGAGWVYRGCTEGGKELAVKVLKPTDDVVKDFVSEVEIHSSVEHENAMSLVGFCLDGGKDRLMLVYDYMPRGSLEEVLHGHGKGKGGVVVLGWPERYRVAVGVARALEYLHGDGEGHRPMIHRDIKSSNILVAGDFEPKLCDFGIAMWADDAAAQVTGDDLAGTFGYLAPEYFMHGKVSDKIDVYAFGVVLLELISGRKPVSAGGAKGKGSLVMWANSVIQGGNIMDLVDPNLPVMDGDRAEVERMALAAALCIRRVHQFRPSMSNVVKLLAGDCDAVCWAKSQLGLPIGDDNDGDGGHSCGAVTSSPEKNDIQSYINLALRDVIDDDASSVGSGVSLEEYLKGRWSRSSSFEG